MAINGPADLKEDGIHITPHKTVNTTSKRWIIDRPVELRAAVSIAIDVLLVNPSPYRDVGF